AFAADATVHCTDFGWLDTFIVNFVEPGLFFWFDLTGLDDFGAFVFSAAVLLCCLTKFFISKFIPFTDPLLYEAFIRCEAVIKTTFELCGQFFLAAVEVCGYFFCASF